MFSPTKIGSVLMIWTLLSLLGAPEVNAGPVAGALCSAGCAALVCACYGAAGAVFGTVVAAAAAPPAILACNAAFGTCMANCAAATVAPVP